MTTPFLPCVEVEPVRPATCAVICLHGLGADGHDLEPLIPHLRHPRQDETRWVLPHAPVRPVTWNMGMRMRAWYDVREIALQSGHDEAGIRASAAAVSALIERERGRGIADSRIHLMGFSQGGAMALHVGLRHPRRLAGIVALSTYLVLADSLERELAASQRGLPIFMAHGIHDPVVPLEAAIWSRDRLSELGLEVTWAEYPMPHAILAEEIEDLSGWLSTAGAPPPIPGSSA
jgi:phospholipase/carboxylesterase